MLSVPATVVSDRYARGSLVAAIIVTGLWHLLNDAPVLLNGWSQFRSPTAASASAGAWVAYTVVGAVAAVQVLRGGGRGVVLPAIALPILLAGTVVGVLACPPEQAFGGSDWAWGAFGWFALLVLWRRPIGWLVGALVVNALAVLATIALTQPVDRVDVARWAMIVYGTGVLQLGLAGGARFLQNDATRAAKASTAQAETITARVAAEAVHAARQRRYEEVGRAAGEVLAGLASGRLDPTKPAIQRGIAVQAASLRRLLAEHDDVPDPLLHELRACADIAERRGVAVDLQTVGKLPPLPVQVRRSLAEAPIQVLTAARTAARITVASTTDQVAVGVVADADLDEHSLPTGGQSVVSYQREGETLCLQSTWRV